MKIFKYCWHTQRIETSQKMIKEQIDVTVAAENIKVRKEKILKMVKEVSDIKTVNKEDSAIANNAINVHLDEKKILEFVSNFGDVSSSLLPILISLKDNGQNGVVIQWKLNGTKPAKTAPYKVRFEWMQTQTNDDEKEQWQQTEAQKDRIDEMNEQTVDVVFDTDIALFDVRLRIFDEVKNEWSLPSNAMSVQMKNCFKMPQALNESILVKGGNNRRLMMENVLPQTLKNKKFELLLIGSVHGLAVKSFNERCKNKGSVFVIAQTKEYGRTFGGYTKIGWKSGSAGHQRDDDAFLFYIDPKKNKAQRFPVKNAQNAVYYDNRYGVLFGGNDLWLDGKTCSRFYFDYSSDKDQTPLSGGANGWTVKDYEVWKVI